MNQVTTKVRAQKISARKSPVTMMYPKGAGICPVVTDAAGTSSQLRDIATQVMMGVTMALSHMGIISKGLKTIGVPKTIGSLMLKIAGAIQIPPRVLRRVDFERIIITFRGSVQPAPPNVTSRSR